MLSVHAQVVALGLYPETVKETAEKENVERVEEEEAMNITRRDRASHLHSKYCTTLHHHHVCLSDF